MSKKKLNPFFKKFGVVPPEMVTRWKKIVKQVHQRVKQD